MKKRIIIISLLITIVITILTCILLVMNREKDFEIVVIKKTYNYVDTFDETGEFTVDIYVSSDNAFITEIKSVGNCYLSCEDEKLEVKLVSIIDKDKTLKLDGKSYYLYQYKFNIVFMTESEIEFNFLNAYLEMDFPEQLININIGSFYYLKVESLKDEGNKLLFSKIRPIVNVINNNKTLVGINIKVENLTNEKIEICNIKLLSSSASLSGLEVVYTDEEYDSNTSINNILGYGYDYKYQEDKKVSFNVEESKDVVIPIKYKNNYVLDKAGLYIEYKVNGKMYKYYINEFLFFSSTTLNINNTNLEMYHYENN